MADKTWVRVLEIILTFIGKVLENKLALVMLFVLTVDAVLGAERMESLLTLVFDNVAKLIP